MIVGLGLMGGSLAATCRKKFPKSEIVGISRDKKAVSFAKKKKWINSGGSNSVLFLRDVDLVILCTPIDVIPQFLKQIDEHIDRTVIVTDVGSVKESIQKKVNRMRLKHVQFVGAHPMVGSHVRGIASADPLLYEKGLTFIIQNKNISIKNQAFVKKFWQKISSKVISTSAEKHDQIVANTSHLPHMIASCLIQTLPNSLMQQVSSGFKDSTRIAAGHESIWLPIFLENKNAVSVAIRAFQKELKSFEGLLRTENSDKLKEYLQRSRQKREKI